MSEGRHERAWVLRAQAGDREALDRLLQAVQEPLYRYLGSLMGRGPGTEDVLQEVFVLLYRHLRGLHDPALFRPWAYRIASREAFRALRKERRRPEIALEAGALATLPEPPERLEAAERAALLHDLEARVPALLEAVSPASRAVLALHYLEEMTLEEVAGVLGIPLGTAKSRLAYGLETLRRLRAGDDRT
jgi:RNA polymerase sigma-70 factor (ECF subfamily)